MHLNQVLLGRTGQRVDIVVASGHIRPGYRRPAGQAEECAGGDARRAPERSWRHDWESPEEICEASYGVDIRGVLCYHLSKGVKKGGF